MDSKSNTEKPEKSGHKPAKTSKTLSPKVALVLRVLIATCFFVAPVAGFLWKFYPQFIKEYGHLKTSIQTKIEILSQNELKIYELSLENAQLRIVIEKNRYQRQSNQSQSFTEKYEEKLKKDTGSGYGRNQAAVRYREPEDLLPSQLCALAIGYFDAGEFEKAATLLTKLNAKNQNQQFCKTIRGVITTGIAWYRLDNFKTADQYFDQAIAFGDTPETRPFITQAILWKALTAEKLGLHAKSQEWLDTLLSQYSQSEEASWVNQMRAAGNSVAQPELRKPVKRLPASANKTVNHSESHADSHSAGHQERTKGITEEVKR